MKHEPPALLTLLSVVTQREREALVASLERRGFAGIALPAVRLLAELGERSRSIQALADATGTTKQFCGREVARLRRAGYLSASPSTDDGRVTLISLAPRGRKLLDEVGASKRELETAIIKLLGPSDARALRRSLEQLARRRRAKV